MLREDRQSIELLMRQQAQAFQQELEHLYPTLLAENSIADYLSELRTRDYYRHYERFTPKLNKMLESIKQKNGLEAVALLHKLGLSKLIVDFLNGTETEKLPKKLWPLYIFWFDRIKSDFSSQPNLYYDHNKSFWPLRKDLCVCSGRAIPIGGAMLVEIRLIPRKKMIKNAGQFSEKKKDSGDSYSELSQLVHYPSRIYKVIRFIQRWVKRILVDYDLCFVLHTVERDIIDFNEEQINLAYKNLVELLKRNQRVWGVFRKSWFLDPALHKISPHLKFLISVPQANGAELYRQGPCSLHDTRKAILMSPLRSKMYKEGTYRPQNYFYFWPRQAIINGHYSN